MTERCYSVDILVAAKVWAESGAEAINLAQESHTNWADWTVVEPPELTKGFTPEEDETQL